MYNKNPYRELRKLDRKTDAECDVNQVETPI